MRISEELEKILQRLEIVDMRIDDLGMGDITGNAICETLEILEKTRKKLEKLEGTN